MVSVTERVKTLLQPRNAEGGGGGGGGRGGIPCPLPSRPRTSAAAVSADSHPFASPPTRRAVFGSRPQPLWGPGPKPLGPGPQAAGARAPSPCGPGPQACTEQPSPDAPGDFEKRHLLRLVAPIDFRSPGHPKRSAGRPA